MTELRLLASALRNPLLWATLLLSLLFATVAYQFPFNYTLNMGSQDASPYITNFYPPQDAQGKAARWSHAYSYITLPGTGGNRPLRVKVEFNPSRAEINNPPPVNVSGFVGGDEIYRRTLQPSAGWQTMTLDVGESHPAALAARDLVIELRTDVYRPPDYQGNELGILLSRVSVEPLPGAPWRFVVPNVRVMLLLAALVLGTYLLLARAWAIRSDARTVPSLAPLVALLVGIALAVGLVLNLVALSEALRPLALLMLGCYLALVAALRLLPRLTPLLLAEGRALNSALRYWPLFILLVMAPLLFSFGFQSPIDFKIDVGSGHDTPFISDFNPPIFPLPDGSPGDYRTTSARSYITIPAVGSDNVYSVTLRLNPGTGPASRGEIRILANGSEVARAHLSQSWQDLSFQATSGSMQAFTASNLQLEIDAPAEVVEGGEQRGVLVDWVSIKDAGAGYSATLHRSPLHEAGLLLGVVLLYLLVVRSSSGLSPSLPACRLGLLAAAPTVLVIAWSLRQYRIEIAAALPHLLTTLFAGYLLLSVGSAIELRTQKSKLQTPKSKIQTPTFALAFMLRYGFSALPQLNVVDLPYHLKWLKILIGGNLNALLLPGELSKVPPEWNLNVLIPKSPLFYMVMWPLGLFKDLDLGTAMLFVVSLLDAAMALVVFALVRRINWRWAWWAATLYAVMPLAFRAFAFGILPTVFAQALTLVALLIPTLWPEKLRKPAWFVSWALLLAASLVAFPTALAFNTLLIVLLALAWFWRRAAPRASISLMLGGLVAALVVSFFSYYDLYVEPLLSHTLPALASSSASLRGRELWPGGPAEMLGWTADYVINWLPLVLLSVAILYTWPTAGSSQPHKKRLATLMLAWLSILLFGMLLNLRFDMIGKHLYYTMPATAIASGLVFSRLWRLQSARPYARILVALASISVVWYALEFMAGRI